MNGLESNIGPPVPDPATGITRWEEETSRFPPPSVSKMLKTAVMILQKDFTQWSGVNKRRAKRNKRKWGPYQRELSNACVSCLRIRVLPPSAEVMTMCAPLERKLKIRHCHNLLSPCPELLETSIIALPTTPSYDTFQLSPLSLRYFSPSRQVR